MNAIKILALSLLTCACVQQKSFAITAKEYAMTATTSRPSKKHLRQLASLLSTQDLDVMLNGDDNDEIPLIALYIAQQELIQRETRLAKAQNRLRAQIQSNNTNVPRRVHKRIVEGVDINYRDEHGITLLMLAAREGNRDVIELLLHYGADPAIRDLSDRSARDYAKTRDIRALLTPGERAVLPAHDSDSEASAI